MKAGCPTDVCTKDLECPCHHQPHYHLSMSSQPHYHLSVSSPATLPPVHVITSHITTCPCHHQPHYHLSVSSQPHYYLSMSSPATLPPVHGQRVGMITLLLLTLTSGREGQAKWTFLNDSIPFTLAGWSPPVIMLSILGFCTHILHNIPDTKNIYSTHTHTPHIPHMHIYIYTKMTTHIYICTHYACTPHTHTYTHTHTHRGRERELKLEHFI